MLRKRSLLFLVCFLPLSILPVIGAQLEEEVRVDLIEIWVKVTEKGGRIVSDLGPEDFRIYIDGKETELRCFDKTFEDPFDFVQKSEVEETEQSEPLKKRYIFFFDLLNTSPRNVDFLKKQLVSFLDSSFRDYDEGMVFALLPSVHLGVVQAMTSNKEALIDVVEKLKGNATLESRIRNNERELLDVLTFSPGNVPAPLGAETAQGRDPEQIRAARGLARSFTAQEENFSKFTVNSFLSIAEYLSRSHFDGRLVMIYVSGGFALRPGQNYYEIIERAIENSQVVGTEDLAFRDRPTEDFEHEVRKTIGTLNRLNVTIYSIDAKGLIANDRGAERDSRQIALGFSNVPYMRELQDSLVLIAQETGGTAFTNSQNFHVGLSSITSDMNQQYWLCADVPPSNKKSVYHKIEVKVPRPGVEVRHRKGYME